MQVIIDGCKREYEIDGNQEIDRISRMNCMSIKKQCGITSTGKPKYIKYDFPEFMKYTREIKTTKDGRELSYDVVSEAKDRLKNRINPTLICPMNYLQKSLDKIQNATTARCTPTKDFFIKMKGTANNNQMTKIRQIVEEYNNRVVYFQRHLKNVTITNEISNDNPENNYAQYEYLKSLHEETIDKLSKIKINNICTINRLIETTLGIESENNNPRCKKITTKHTRKMLNLLYQTNKEKFLINFSCE